MVVFLVGGLSARIHHFAFISNGSHCWYM